MGRCRGDPDEPGAGRVTAQVNALDVLDADRVAKPEAPLRAVRRRASGRYPVDPFGLDPQIADLCVPIFTLAVRVQVSGGEHVPDRGPAVIVANRGFGIAEPAALSGAVLRSTGRRLRVVGAPAWPFVGAVTRRLGAIASSESDVAAALRSGHLVGVPLAPTGLRTGAGAAPLAVAAPVVGLAATPTGKPAETIPSEVASNSVEDAKFYLEMGIASYRDGDLAAAIADFDLAIELNPNLKDAYINQGVAWYRVGSFNRAFDDIAQAARIENSH